MRRMIFNILKTCFLFIFTKNGFLASFYYCFFSRRFYSEHLSVLRGKKKYNNSMSKGDGTFILRRNIHRIEKGLIMRPQKGVFGLDYIEETVLIYKTLLSNKRNAELQWATDVLNDYFSVVDTSNQIIKKCKGLFLKINKNIELTNCKPSKRSNKKHISFCYDDFLELSKYRKSIRWYKQQIVPKEIIDKAVNIAKLSPSACNRQPFRFMVYDEKDKIMQVLNLTPGSKNFAENIPGIIVVVGDLGAYFNERDRHIIYIDSSLSSMSLIYALEIQGVSSCVLNWPDIEKNNEEIYKLLNIESHERVIMVIAFGYALEDQLIPYSLKKDIEEMRNYNI